jgi:ATP-dependent exoDNAse (exonuclease V) beta subunit
MLQDHAFESRVPFDAELVSDLTVLRDEVVRDFWASRLYDAPQELIRFVSKKLTLDNLGNLARKVLAHPHAEVIPKVVPGVLGEAGAENWSLRVLALRREFATYASEEMRRRMEEASSQSFDDLLQRLDRALDGPGGTYLAHEIRDRFPAALIGEFQATSISPRKWASTWRS